MRYKVMYNLYKYAGTHVRRDNADGVTFRKLPPPISNIHNLLWHISCLLCGKRFYEYQIVKQGRVVSTAQVCPRIWQLRFFPKGGWHIGPCHTISSERAHGYYPLLLQYIIETNPGRKWYMLVDQQNVASQRGIAKVNFIKYGEGIRSRWGCYVRCH